MYLDVKKVLQVNRQLFTLCFYTPVSFELQVEGVTVLLMKI